MSRVGVQGSSLAEKFCLKEILPETKKLNLLAFRMRKPIAMSDNILKKSEFPTFFRSKELIRFDTRWRVGYHFDVYAYRQAIPGWG